LLDGAVGYDLHAPVRTGLEATAPGADTWTDHLARYGPMPSSGAAPEPEHLLETLDAIRLAGRGGAHFSVATKWRSALASGGGGTVVANGVEGEPASAKDAALLTHRPHLVLDGLACAARAIRASDAVMYLREDSWQVRHAVGSALAERSARCEEDGPPVRVVTAPHRYLSGEATAVLRALSGGPAIPQFRHELATVRGLNGRPTLVHNVETLARVALAARAGAGGYRDSTLVTVVDGRRRVVLELDPTRTIAQTLVEALGVFAVPQAVLLGGYGGAWLPWDAAADLPLEHQALRAAGVGLGAGVVAPLPTHVCGVVQTAAIVRHLARAGAGQCGPCLFGLPAVADLMTGLAHGESDARRLRRLHRYTHDLAGRGGCNHPDGVVRLVRSALTTFADDVDAHLRLGRCRYPAAPPTLPLPGPSDGDDR
jgi:NADH:ubiquinone oxidoreductase subunit F (NADH-binding)